MSIPDVTAMNGRVIVLIAYRELYDEFMADKGKLREVASIARSNIQAELKAEDAWVQMTARPGVHRYRLPWKNGARDILRTYWVLDYEKCPPELRDVFRSIYERELEEVDYALNDKDEVVHQSELNRAEED